MLSTFTVHQRQPRQRGIFQIPQEIFASVWGQSAHGCVVLFVYESPLVSINTYPSTLSRHRKHHLETYTEHTREEPSTEKGMGTHQGSF